MPKTNDAATALRRYETACANAETIGADGWRTMARDLCDAADALESRATGIEQQRKLRDRAQDCADRAKRAESRRAERLAPTTSPTGECDALGCNRPCARCAQRVARGGQSEHRA